MNNDVLDRIEETPGIILLDNTKGHEIVSRMPEGYPALPDIGQLGGARKGIANKTRERRPQWSFWMPFGIGGAVGNSLPNRSRMRISGTS
jgi:hypothetical protein